jgi:DNA cross-link repair 1A protein
MVFVVTFISLTAYVFNDMLIRSANHCPGAAIILFEAPNGMYHLHTGDMRYHERMKSYPLLREVVEQRKIDTVFLDTTYAHPKHAFLPQSEAVDMIASQTSDLLKSDQPRTLVLLSCYSIGKEKVLWEVSKQTGQLIFANERKRRMLECIRPCDSCKCTEECLKIIDRCTDDPSSSDIHVIPMGVAGRIWPFFQPDYKSCLDYARQHSLKYDRIVAFIPTGWADASNWNKKNACKTVSMDGVTVSVRLVAYSEHSTFSELQSLMNFLQPRLIIPTVYGDMNERRKIQARFRGSIDSKRAKSFFFRSMVAGTQSTLEDTQIKKSVSPKCAVKASTVESDAAFENQKVGTDSNVSHNYESQMEQRMVEANVQSLIAMGFPEHRARESLRETKYDVTSALDRLLNTSSNNSGNNTRNCSSKRPGTTTPSKRKATLSSGPKNPVSTPTSLITSYFAIKKR